MGSFQFVLNGALSVGTMSSESGIFIGQTNYSVGWSSHNKSNAAFGGVGGSYNLLYHNIYVLSDPDFIDTPIDDRDIHLVNEIPGEDNLTDINLGELKVNSMLQNSGLFIGKGIVSGMDANQKTNNASGSVYGNVNKILQNSNYTYDSDLIDGNIFDQDIKMVKSSRGEDLHGRLPGV